MSTTTTRPPPSSDIVSSMRGAQLPSWAGPAALGTGAIVGLAVYLGGLGSFKAIILGWAVVAVGLPVWSRVVEGRRKSTDRLVTVLVASAFGIALFPLFSILATVIGKGAPVLSPAFFNSSMRNVVGPGGGIYHALVGTLLITLAASIISIPIGLFTSIYLVEYGGGRKLARSITFLVDVMTGIPSIVAGLFAYAVFVIFFGEGVRLGIGGAVALSVLMIPVVVRSCEEMLKLVPNELREASYALGVPKWRTVLKVVLPTALAGIVTGITLAVARVIGETAPLLVIAGFSDSVNFNLFHDRMATLPVFAYSAVTSPGVPPGPSIDRAWGAALVLLLLVMLLNLVARLVSYYFSPKGER